MHEFYADVTLSLRHRWGAVSLFYSSAMEYRRLFAIVLGLCEARYSASISLKCPSGSSIQGKSIYSPSKDDFGSTNYLFCILCGVPGESAEQHQEICYNQHFIQPYSEGNRRIIKFEYHDCSEELSLHKDGNHHFDGSPWFSLNNSSDFCTESFCSARFSMHLTIAELVKELRFDPCTDYVSQNEWDYEALTCPTDYFVGGYTIRKKQDVSYGKSELSLSFLNHFSHFPRIFIPNFQCQISCELGRYGGY